MGFLTWVIMSWPAYPLSPTQVPRATRHPGAGIECLQDP